MVRDGDHVVWGDRGLQTQKELFRGSFGEALEVYGENGRNLAKYGWSWVEMCHERNGEETLVHRVDLDDAENG